ncbi:class F sortase [Streptomyces sp. NPDC049577]|uniref:class F sortase n=1 Tax=Streptomyces sp. NPDC049577 TaxID=3155153 RepID=UPI0034370578
MPRGRDTRLHALHRLHETRRHYGRLRDTVRWTRSRAAAATALGTAVCAGCWLIDSGAHVQGSPPQPSAAQAFTTGPAFARFQELVPPLSPAAPTRVRIPEIDVDAPLVPLGLQPDGTLTSPPEEDRNLAGWYAAGTPPGAAGTAVIAGHVDTAAGPAVFYNVGILKKGDAMEIARVDGRTAVFTIDAIEVYTRADFPSRKVYGPTGRAELRLITCGGGFSEETSEYLGNVVVYAHLTAVRDAATRRGA